MEIKPTRKKQNKEVNKHISTNIKLFLWVQPGKVVKRDREVADGWMDSLIILKCVSDHGWGYKQAYFWQYHTASFKFSVCRAGEWDFWGNRSGRLDTRSQKSLTDGLSVQRWQLSVRDKEEEEESPIGLPALLSLTQDWRSRRWRWRWEKKKRGGGASWGSKINRHQMQFLPLHISLPAGFPIHLHHPHFPSFSSQKEKVPPKPAAPELNTSCSKWLAVDSFLSQLGFFSPSPLQFFLFCCHFLLIDFSPSHSRPL